MVVLLLVVLLVVVLVVVWVGSSFIVGAVGGSGLISLLGLGGWEGEGS